MQSVTTADFLVTLRLRLGNVPTDELSDASLTEGLNIALRDYSRVKPANRQNLLFTLQPYQEEYPLPDPAPGFVFDVVPAAPTTASARAFGNEFRALELDLVDFHIADLWVMQEKVSQYREMFEQIEWHYDNPPILYITPSPVTALQAIAVVGDVQTIESAPDSDYETLMWGAMAGAQDIWANQRDSFSVMSAPSALGNVEIQNGDRLRELSRHNRAKFQDRLGYNRPFIGRG